MTHPITIEEHSGIHVLRDDLLEGGTKSVFIDEMVKELPHVKEFVYASPVYGGFQIALSIYCKKHQLKATIFCAKRNIRHPNTIACIEYGANIVEVFPGYLSVIEKRARQYCDKTPHTHKIVFGAHTPPNINIIADRARRIFETMGREPDEIWVSVGSGTIITGILQAVNNARVYGVVVGADFQMKHPNLTLIKYPRPFEVESKIQVDFPSMPNYDRKAFEICLEKTCSPERTASPLILFWNVL
jgi:hypothetical protein